MVNERRLAKTMRINAEYYQAFHQAGTSVDEAEKYLKSRGHSLMDFHFQRCSLEELRVWHTAIKPKKRFRHLLRPVEMNLVARFEEAQAEQWDAQAQALIRGNARELGGLSARELIEYAEELTEVQILALIDWEKSNKNRAVVLKELQGMIPGEFLDSPSESASRTEFDYGPNPYADENRKVFQRGRGFIQERCRECGTFTPIDVELLSRILHARANTTRGRVQSWANRQVESGARMSGRIGASEVARANRHAFSRQVSEGIPCSNCGAQLIR